MVAYTDYPITELGDIAGKIAPIRKCDVLFYDGDKYCQVEVETIKKEIKAGYLYQSPGRLGEVKVINTEEIIKEEFEE